MLNTGTGSPCPVDPLDSLVENECGQNWRPKKISSAPLKILVSHRKLATCKAGF